VCLTRWGGGVLTEVVDRHEEVKAAIGGGAEEGGPVRGGATW
jgi:hypothetical protein